MKEFTFATATVELATQAIIWTNVEFSFVKLCGIHPWEISQRVTKQLFCMLGGRSILFKITATYSREKGVNSLQIRFVWYCFLFRSHTHDVSSFRFLPHIYYGNMWKQLYKKNKCGIVLSYSYRKNRHVINAIYKGAIYVCTKIAFTTCSVGRDKDNVSLFIHVYNTKRKDVRHCVFFLNN